MTERSAGNNRATPHSPFRIPSSVPDPDFEIERRLNDPAFVSVMVHQACHPVAEVAADLIGNLGKRHFASHLLAQPAQFYIQGLLLLMQEVDLVVPIRVLLEHFGQVSPCVLQFKLPRQGLQQCIEDGAEPLAGHVICRLFEQIAQVTQQNVFHRSVIFQEMIRDDVEVQSLHINHPITMSPFRSKVDTLTHPSQMEFTTENQRAVEWAVMFLKDRQEFRIADGFSEM